jgi:acetyl esterase/lipase
MKRADIHPELHHPANHITSPPVHRTRLLPLLRPILSRALRTPLVADVTMSLRRAGGVPVRVYQPKAPSGDAQRAALLWVHGGGLILGDAAQDDGTCSRVARDLGLTVVSVDHRLAPEHPFPAAIDDCFAAWRWLVDDAAALGVSPERVVVGGISAGGGLAASLAQRVADHDGPPLAGQLLVCPMLDDRTAADRSRDAANHPIWNNRNNRGGWSAYLGRPAGLAHDAELAPYAVPARRPALQRLAPAWIGVGTLDLFLDEDRAYARRLREAGVACELHEVRGGIHGFHKTRPRAAVSRAFVDSQYAFLRARLGC